MLKRGKAGQGDVRVLLLAYGWILRALRGPPAGSANLCCCFHVRSYSGQNGAGASLVKRPYWNDSAQPRRSQAEGLLAWGARGWVLDASMHREPPAVRLQRGGGARLVQPSRRRDRRLQAVGTACVHLPVRARSSQVIAIASQLTDVVPVMTCSPGVLRFHSEVVRPVRKTYRCRRRRTNAKPG